MFFDSQGSIRGPTAAREALRTVADHTTGKPIPVGDLLNDFDFRQAPLPPLVLPLVR